MVSASALEAQGPGFDSCFGIGNVTAQICQQQLCAVDKHIRFHKRSVQPRIVL